MSFISRLRRSRQHRVSILSAYLVHPFPLRGTSPQGETGALRDLLSVPYGMISILVISHLRWLFPPLVPYGTTFPPRWEACHTILRSLCSLTNRVPLPPLFRGQNKTPRNALFINGSTVSTGCCAPACGERWWRQPPKGECISSPAWRLLRFYTNWRLL